MSPQPIVLFCYPGSPFSAKIEIYLSLRKIPYSACHQPMTWPRPDIQALSISYRRIPILSIGRDIYCDTALILQKLETLFPSNPLGAQDASGQAIEDLLEQWSQTTLMRMGPALLPPSVPLLSDQAFLDDRISLWGKGFSPEVLSQARPGLMVEVGLNIDIIEKFLSDGRLWLQGTENPSLADIHAAFFFQWATDLSPTFLQDRSIAKSHPLAHAFFQRYNALATAENPNRSLIPGSEVLSLLKSADFAEDSQPIENDPTQLTAGQKVAVSRTDDISGHKDVGALVALSARESVIEVGADGEGQMLLRLHCPRRNFMINAC